MRDTLNEYMKTIIMGMMFSLCIYLLFYSPWLNSVGEINAPNEVSHTYLEEIDDHIPPSIKANDITIFLGESVNLNDLLVSATDTDGNDISSTIEFINGDTVITDCVFSPEKTGIYTIKYKVYDSYNFSAITYVNITVK